MYYDCAALLHLLIFSFKLQNAGKFIRQIEGHTQRVQCLEFVDGHVWSGSAHGTILVHDAQVCIVDYSICLEFLLIDVIL